MIYQKSKPQEEKVIGHFIQNMIKPYYLASKLKNQPCAFEIKESEYVFSGTIQDDAVIVDFTYGNGPASAKGGRKYEGCNIMCDNFSARATSKPAFDHGCLGPEKAQEFLESKLNNFQSRIEHSVTTVPVRILELNAA